MSILLGLTGGIGSGKSLASSYFKDLGANIIYADTISRKLTEPGQMAWQEIFQEFGIALFVQLLKCDQRVLKCGCVKCTIGTSA